MKKSTQIFLSDTFFVALGGALLLALASIFYPVLFYGGLAALVILFLFTLIDRQSLRRVEQFEGRSHISKTPELGETTTVTFELNSNSQSVARLSRLRLVLPALQTLRFPKTMVTMNRRYHEGRVTFESTVVAHTRRLGFETIRELRIFARSSFGLWSRAFDAPVPESQFRVIPTRKRASEQTFRDLAAHQRLLYQGTRQILRGRSADQFHSVRKYQYPDSVRHIDHKKSARFGELMTRVYDTFFDHHLILGLDLGRSMRGTIAGSEKCDYYLAACLALAQSAVTARDRISFFGFSQQVHHLIKSTRNLQSFTPLFEGHRELTPRDEESDFTALPSIVQSISGQRSIVILFTDLAKPSVQDSLLKTLPTLAQRHLTVVVSVLDEALSLEKRLVEFTQEKVTTNDYSDLLYSYWIRDRTQSFKAQVGSFGSAVLVVSEQDWLSVVTRLYGLLRESASL